MDGILLISLEKILFSLNSCEFVPLVAFSLIIGDHGDHALDLEDFSNCPFGGAGLTLWAGLIFTSSGR